MRVLGSLTSRTGAFPRVPGISVGRLWHQEAKERGGGGHWRISHPPMPAPGMVGLPTRPVRSVCPGTWSEAMAKGTQVLGPPWVCHWSEIARIELSGQAAVSAGWDVLGCQKSPINRMLLAKGDCLQAVLASLFFPGQQQQVRSRASGAGWGGKTCPSRPRPWVASRSMQSWPLPELGIHLVGAEREDLRQPPSPAVVRGQWPGLSLWPCA